MGVLSTIESIRDRVGGDVVANIDKAIASSLRATTPQLAHLLRAQDFDRGTFTDYFCPRMMIQQGSILDSGSAGWTRPSTGLTYRGDSGGYGVIGTPIGLHCGLRLSRAFLTADAVTVVTASTMADLLNTGGTDVAENGGNILIEREKGLVKIFDLDLRDQFVRVAYTAGFTVNTADEYESVPQWLVDAAEVKAVLNLDRDYPQFRGDRAGDPVSLVRRDDDWRLMVQRKVRYLPNAEFPL